MKRSVILVFMVLAALFTTLAEADAVDVQKDQALFQEAVSAYGRGDYEAAIKGFEALAADGVSASLLYDLGNSYAQAGQTGRAILNYERALRLAPTDPDIRANLEHIRKEKGLFQNEASFGQRFITYLSLNQWIGLAAVSFVLLVLLMLLPDSTGLKRSLRYSLAAVCFLLTLTAVTGAFGQYQHWSDGVVVVPDARLRVSPFETAASVGIIQEGRLLQPEKSHNNFVLVTDETGRSGWLERTAFELIATPQALR